MALETTTAKERKRVYLSTGGPKAVGNRPAATAPPDREVKINPVDGTNPKKLTRPAQGRQSIVQNFGG